jgi:bifunctional oligoribonuclease and PAP phosphatase NrnA
LSGINYQDRLMNPWEPFKRAIEDHSRFLLCTHQDPDADGVGAELALQRALTVLGKETVVLNPDSLPGILKFMDPEGLVRAFDRLDPAESLRLLDEAERIIFLDSALWKRLGKMGPAVSARADKVLIVDHHPSEGQPLPGAVVREQASSTGELIYDLLAELGCPLDERIAFCLYCAIVKDTGSFRFENTSARVLRIAGHLAEYGVSPSEVYDNLFEQNSVSSMICLGRVLNTLCFAYDNRLAYIHLTRRMLEETGAPIEETDNFVNVIRSIDTVRACLYFRETGDGRVKVSLRSRSKDIDINRLAAKFGGGGHRKASGAVLAGPMEEAIQKVVAAAADLFQPPAGP